MGDGFLLPRGLPFRLAIAAMHNDPGYPWTLQSLAERVGLSRSIFALRFRETRPAAPCAMPEKQNAEDHEQELVVIG